MSETLVNGDDSWCYKTYVYRRRDAPYHTIDDPSEGTEAAAAGETVVREMRNTIGCVTGEASKEAEADETEKEEAGEDEGKEADAEEADAGEEGEDPLRDAGAVTVHTSLNLFEGGTGCHEWSAGFYLAEAGPRRPRLTPTRL